MIDQTTQLQIPPGPFKWLLGLGGLLNLDLSHAIPDGPPGDAVQRAIDDLRWALSDARICQPAMASLKGDSFSRGCFTIERGVLCHLRVWVRAQAQGEGTGRIGHEGTVFMVDNYERVFWAENDSKLALDLLRDILQAPDLQLRGSVR
ncbi:hypothetical protein [Geothrix campi]|uniref:hypothetical protein n=1 Tax=Geothrix campi TaxID=2966450 RepID=UPI00214761F9|nr:hypothetical protein [Geothrix sp. SG10]